MIEKNIKLLGKKDNINQLEFSKITDTLLNSITLHENKLNSSLREEYIEAIVKALNVSYEGIVEEEKISSSVEDYKLTLKIEILKERGANLLVRLYHYQDTKGIKYDDEQNPWVLMSDDLSDVINTKIYLVDTFEELERYIGYLDGIERVLEVSEKWMVA